VTWLLPHILPLGAVSNAIVVRSAHFTVAILHAPAARRSAEAVRLAALNAGILAVLTGGYLGPAWLGISVAAVVFAAITARLVTNCWCCATRTHVLRRQLSSRQRWDHADRLWLTALSRLVNRRRWQEVFPVTPDLALAP
jgi:hypothetical protein